MSVETRLMRIQTLVSEANEANERERDMKLSDAFKIYPKAVAWSMILSSCIIMEGFGTSIVGSCKLSLLLFYFFCYYYHTSNTARAKHLKLKVS